MTHAFARIDAEPRSRTLVRTGLAFVLAACFVLQGRAEAGRYDSRGAQRMAAGNGTQARPSNTAFGAPEIDASLAAGGIILLVGGTLILTHARKTRCS